MSASQSAFEAGMAWHVTMIRNRSDTQFTCIATSDPLVHFRDVLKWLVGGYCLAMMSFGTAVAATVAWATWSGTPTAVSWHTYILAGLSITVTILACYGAFSVCRMPPMAINLTTECMRPSEWHGSMHAMHDNHGQVPVHVFRTHMPTGADPSNGGDYFTRPSYTTMVQGFPAREAVLHPREPVRPNP